MFSIYSSVTEIGATSGLVLASAESEEFTIGLLFGLEEELLLELESWSTTSPVEGLVDAGLLALGLSVLYSTLPLSITS